MGWVAVQVTVTQTWAERHWKLIGLLLAGVIYGAYRAGESVSDSRHEAERQQAAIQVAERERELQQQVSQAQTQATKTIEVVKWRTRTIREQVSDWASRTPSGDCRLDADGVRLWNAAHARPASGVE